MTQQQKDILPALHNNCVTLSLKAYQAQGTACEQESVENYIRAEKIFNKFVTEIKVVPCVD